MQPDAADKNAESAAEAPKSGAKVRLLSLEDVDGRTVAYRRCVDLISHIERDLGGARQLSTAQQQLVRHAALTATMLEDFGPRWLPTQPIVPPTFIPLLH